MTKSRLSLKNSARAALNSLILTAILLISGCSSSTAPTYIKENIDQSIEHLCKKEYNLDVKAKLVGETVWIYIPVEDLFVKSDKPEKFTEKFEITQLQDIPDRHSLQLEYAIKPIPEKEKTQELKYNKEVLEKINNVWKVLRRVVFSLDRAKDSEPKFFCMISADIKNGFEMTEVFYYLDLKKVSYEYISWGEYQHRAIQDTGMSPSIIGDKEGRHIDYHNITMQEFIIGQILHRIKMKFQKPEVDKNVDVDKEIIKIIAYTIKTYDYKDFDLAELTNLVTNNKTVLNQAALWAKTIE